ncbi:MAG: mevalonate kinase [Anaerolineae bacterium]|nr:mevalonate kinase [Thermoflexales bacterium]MDW8407455.1 mevalonate kinase [Anaerolineae bacterium]
MTERAIAPVERSACAKVILCGEHAVVYGRPAIALPLSWLRTRVRCAPAQAGFRILAPDVNRVYTPQADAERPLIRLAAITLDFVQSECPARLPLHAFNAELTIHSDIPPGAHLGSSAAVAVAVARALAASLGRELSPDEASALAFEAEKLFHGAPSGIDNTVVAYEQPVWFVRHSRQDAQDTEIGPMTIPALPHLVIADTGIATPTRIPVGDVRRGWEAAPERYERLFDRIGQIVVESRAALAAGEWVRLGELMNANQDVLRELGVSCAEVDALCDAARIAGALGAKLSGGGRGGNIIALARDAQHAAELRQTLLHVGAKRVM